VSFRSTTARAIQLPLGALVGFSRALLSCTRDNDKVCRSPSVITYVTNVFQEDGRAEPSVRAMEEAAVPEICALGNDLLSRLATWYVGAISPPPSPHLLLTWYIHLVQDVILRRTRGDSQESYCFILNLLHRRTCTTLSRCNTVTSDTHMGAFRNQYVAFLRALVSLLLNVHMMDFPLVLNRIAKVLLSTLSVLLPTQSDIGTGPVSVTSSKGRKSRKRAHDYERDELFKTTTSVICPTSEHNAMILTTLDGML